MTEKYRKEFFPGPLVQSMTYLSSLKVKLDLKAHTKITYQLLWS